jgi:hypothetical protein
MIKNKIVRNEVMDDKAQLTKYKKELAEMKVRTNPTALHCIAARP